MKKILLLLSVCLFSICTKAQCPITITGNTTICSGYQTTLTASSTATSYTWMPGAVNSATMSANPNATTTYTVIGTDGICTDSATVTLTVNPTPTLTPVSNPTICAGQATTLSVSGTATTYTWAPGYGISSTSGAVVTCNVPSTTIYTVVGTAGTCSAVTSVWVTVNPTPTLAINSISPSCTGVCDGWLICSIGQSYHWDIMGTVYNTQSISNVCPGSYTCVLTDYNSCTAVVTGSVTAKNLIIYTSVVPSACGQSDGSVIIDSLSAPGNFLYSFYIYAPNSSPVFSGVSAGTYTLGASDAATGCAETTTVTVNDSNFIAQLTPIAPGCNLCNGTISTNILGGTPPYNYNWSNGANTSSVNGLCAGNHYVSITDVGGCFTSTSINLVSSSAPIIHIDSVVNIACNGISSGSATISVTGGTGPYTYLWNTTPTQTTNIATGLQIGMHNVTVTDNTGCSVSQNIYVSNLNSIYVYPTATNPTNCGTLGSSTVNAYGGLPPYIYTWSNGATGPTATNLSTGIYTVTAVDANGCVGQGFINIPTQCLNIIKGRIYNDSNQNCVQDVGEIGLANQPVIVYPGYYYGYTDANGVYVVMSPNMTNTVIANNISPYLSPICPATGSLTANFSTPGDTSNNNNFGYYADPNYLDLSIHPGWSSSYPGSTKTYWFLHWNKSYHPVNAVVVMVYDARLQYTGCTNGGVHYPGQHKIEWTYNNLPPTTFWYNYNWPIRPEAYFNVPVTITLNDTLHTHFEIQPLIDNYPSDNSYDYDELVTGSHDPNEKTVFPKGFGPNGDILRSDSVLFYTIHFQNNGNDTAFRVVVVDTLSQFLDPATVIPGAANHTYKFNLSGKGICTWTFDSIMLPDSLTNEPASNGYLNFTVRQKPNNAFGSVIKNTADIYFDYNSAVITNTTINTISAPLSATEYFAKNDQLLLYPNPTSSNFTLQYNLKNESKVVIEIRNMLGEIVKTVSLVNKQKGVHAEEISTSTFTNGIYLVKLMSEGGQQTQKLIIQK